MDVEGAARREMTASQRVFDFFICVSGNNHPMRVPRPGDGPWFRPSPRPFADRPPDPAVSGSR